MNADPPVVTLIIALLSSISALVVAVINAVRGHKAQNGSQSVARLEERMKVVEGEIERIRTSHHDIRNTLAILTARLEK